MKSLRSHRGVSRTFGQRKTAQCRMPVIENLECRQLMSASVAGVVYNDLNVSNTIKPGDPKISGVRVYADLGNHGQYVAGDPTAISNSQGAYTITGLPTGKVTLREVVPAGYRQSEPSNGAPHVVTIANASTHLTNVNFGDTHKTRYSGFVYNDSNSNGDWNKGEPVVAGATVFLDPYGTGQFSPSDPHTTTNAAGYWVIGNLAPGYKFTAHVIPPAGDTQTFPMNNGGYQRMLQAGQTADYLNFGVRPAAFVINSQQRSADAIAGYGLDSQDNFSGSSDAGLFNTTTKITDPESGDHATANLESTLGANSLFAAGSFDTVGDSSEATDTVVEVFTLSKATKYSFGYDIFGNNFNFDLINLATNKDIITKTQGANPSVTNYHDSESGTLSAGTYEVNFSAYKDPIHGFATDSFLMNFNLGI